MYPILTFTVGHTHGEGEMKTELFKNVGIAPKFKIFFLLTVELRRLAPSQFAGMQRRPKSIKGSGAERGKPLERDAVADRSEAEKTVKLGNGQRGDSDLTLAGSKIRDCVDKIFFFHPCLEAERGHHGGMKAITSRRSGQLGHGLRIKATKGRLRQRNATDGVPAKPTTTLEPER